MAWHYPQDFSLCCLKLWLVGGSKHSDCHRSSLEAAFACMRARCAFATFSTVSSRTPFLNVAVTFSLPTSADSSIKIWSERPSAQTVLFLVSSFFDSRLPSIIRQRGSTLTPIFSSLKLGTSALTLRASSVSTALSAMRCSSSAWNQASSPPKDASPSRRKPYPHERLGCKVDLAEKRHILLVASQCSTQVFQNESIMTVTSITELCDDAS